MIVHLLCSDPEVEVEYGWGEARVPVAGDSIHADGSDAALPVGRYRVLRVAFEVTSRGPVRAVALVERV